MIFEFNFSIYTLQYLICPFAGSILALIFYEQIYVKTQEYLEEGSDNGSMDGIGGGINDFDGEIEPGVQNNRTADED